MKKTILFWALALGIINLFAVLPRTVAQSIKWTSRADLPLTTPSVIGGRSAMCFAINGKIYVGGGYIASLTNSREFYEYDTATNVWTAKADLPASLNRTAGIAFAIGGKGYIGLGSENYLDISGGAIPLADLWEYNPTLDTWVGKTPFPDTGRDGAACFVVNNKAYIVGGDLGAYATADVWEYNPSADAWTAKAQYPAGGISDPFAFALGTGASARGYVSCGRVGSAASKKTYAYDPATNTWTAKADYPGSPVRGGTSFTMNNKGYCGLAGLNFTVYSDTFYAYDATAGTWGPAITTFPGAARGYGVAASFGNKAYLGAGWTYASGTGETFYRDWYRVMDTAAPSSILPIVKKEQGLTIYPNPAKEILNIDVADMAIVTGEVALFNLVGRVMVATNWTKGAPVSIGRLPAGQYVVRLVTEREIFYKQVTVKQ